MSVPRLSNGRISWLDLAIYVYQILVALMVVAFVVGLVVTCPVWQYL